MTKSRGLDGWVGLVSREDNVRLPLLRINVNGIKLALLLLSTIYIKCAKIHIYNCQVLLFFCPSELITSTQTVFINTNLPDLTHHPQNRDSTAKITTTTSST